MDYGDIVQLLIALVQLATAVVTWQKIRDERRQLRAKPEEVNSPAGGAPPPPAEGTQVELGGARRKKKRRGRERKIRQLNLLLVASLLLLPVNLGVLAWRYRSLPGPAGAPQVTMTYPADGAAVAWREMVRGTARAVPAGNLIWLVVYPHETARLYPQDNPATVQADGRWSSLAVFGGERDAGRKFDVAVVLVNEDAERVFRGYLRDASGKRDWAGLDSLPAGVTIYDRVTVTRK